jgi:hypothetical protein
MRKTIIQSCIRGVLLAGVFVLVLSLSGLGEVRAVSMHQFEPGIGSAVIDGYVDPTEWAAADSYALTMTNSTMTGTLYVMQSMTDLYLGFTIDDDEFTTGEKFGLYGDTVQFEFDDDNSGLLFDVGENKVTIFAATPFYRDAHFVNTTGSSHTDISEGGEENGEGLSARHADKNHYELRFPLCSGDDYDFCLGPGRIFGLRVKYYDMVPDNEDFAYSAHLYPGGELDSLVTIQTWALNNYLPLICR